MTLHVSVQGGTDAGTKRPFEGKPKGWECACRKNAGHLKRCPDCKQERP